MTPDPTPQPDHGAAGFCTDHVPPAVGRKCGWCGGPHHDPGDCTVAQQTEAQRLCDADRWIDPTEGTRG